MLKIAVANEKGGVAKTTTAASLGAALAETGKKVLLIDLDAQANLTLALGFDPRTISYSNANLLMNAIPVGQIIQSTPFKNLYLLPSNPQMGLAEQFLPIHQGYEFFLRNALSSLQSSFDYAVIDCPPYLGAVTTNAFAAADVLLIPTQAEYFSIYALQSLMDKVKQTREQINPQLTYRLLLTLFDKRNKIHRILREQLHKNFSTGMFETIINIDTKLRESAIAGSPIIYHASRSRSAVQYRALAQEIIQYVEETKALQPA